MKGTTPFTKEILQQILDVSPDPLLITDSESNIIYANTSWEKLTGYSFAEVKNKNPRILQSGKTPPRIYKAMWARLQQKKPFISDGIRDKKKNGSEYQISSSIYPITQNDVIKYFVQIQHDITFAKKMDEFRKAFLSLSAHELKTPITVLKLLTQSHLLKAKKRGEDTINISELELIDQEIDRLITLINDMLDSSRFETGKEVMTFETIDLAPVIKKTVKKIQIFAKNHTVRIDHLIPNTIVIADSMRIEQVLLNLLSNAVKYSPPEKTVRVSMRNDKKRVIISVSDEGVGIPKSKQKLIFDRYYQVKSKSKVGFGLGLYIAKEIIKKHKGKLWVESIKGKGSTFYFSLPRFV